MTYKNKTLDEAREALEEAVADLVWFGEKPAAIHDVTDDAIERANERMAP